MTWSWRCETCNGSGYVQAGRMANGRVGVRAIHREDFDPHDLSLITCADCPRRAKETITCA